MSQTNNGLTTRWANGGVGYRRRIALLTVLILMLVGVSSAWGYYAYTREPLSALLPSAPVVAEVLKPHYLFSIYDVDQPVSVAVSPDGERLYVVESGGERLVKAFNREGSFLFSLQPLAANLSERVPIYAAVAANGDVFVSDRGKHTIYVYGADGNYQTILFPPSGETRWSPFAMAFAGENIYITDTTPEKHRILVYDWNGRALRMFGEEGTTPGQFWYPNAVQVDDSGLIYVSDSNNGRLQVFDAEGNLLYVVGGLNLPRGMAIDSLGRLNVVDTVGQQVRVYDLDSQPAELLYDLGDFGLGDGEFNFPNDIAADLNERLYIADRENSRVQVWSY